jgi:hypothetical protein
LRSNFSLLGATAGKRRKDKQEEQPHRLARRFSEGFFSPTLKNSEKNCKVTESYPQVFHRVIHRFSTDFPNKFFRKF